MKAKCQSCASCGMPMENNEDFALSDPKSNYCSYCTDQQGQLLPWDQILKNNASYLKESQGLTDPAAQKMALDLLKSQPAWKHIEA